MSKLWGGRFTKKTDQLVEEYTASIMFDKELAEEDIQGSLAHVTMLGKCGILPAEDVEKIKDGLHKIQERIRRGEMEYSIADEDIHMNIEKSLLKKLDPVGGKLHTGAAATIKWQQTCICSCASALLSLSDFSSSCRKHLLEQAKNNVDTILPGYTHLQRAQPILVRASSDGVCVDVPTGY